jgi:hypothetical protein
MAPEPYREAHIEDPEDLRALRTFLDDIDLVSEYNGQLDTTNHVSLEETGSEWTTTSANDDLETFSSSDLEGDEWEVDITEPITKDIFANPFPSRPHLHNTLPDLEDEDDSKRVPPPPPLQRQVTPPKNIQARPRASLKESNQFIQEKTLAPTSVHLNNHQDSIMEDFYSAEAKAPTSKQVAPRRVSHDNAKIRSLMAAKKLANTPRPKQTLKIKIKISTKSSPSPLSIPPTFKKQEPKKRRGPRKKEPEVKTPVEQKTELDVLMGRGGCSNHHAGNEAYRNRILQLQPVYKALARKKKTDFGESVVTWVQDRGGRFLNRDSVGGPWYVVTDAMARQKVSQALREDHSEQGRAAKKAKKSQK